MLSDEESCYQERDRETLRQSRGGVFEVEGVIQQYVRPYPNPTDNLVCRSIDKSFDIADNLEELPSPDDKTS